MCPLSGHLLGCTKRQTSGEFRIPRPIAKVAGVELQRMRPVPHTAKPRVSTSAKRQPRLDDRVLLDVAGGVLHPPGQVGVQDDVPQLSGRFWGTVLALMGNRLVVAIPARCLPVFPHLSQSGFGINPDLPGLQFGTS